MNLKYFLIFLAIVFVACKPEVKEIEYTAQVWGNCDKCKATIEKACKINGVNSASWNQDSKLIKIKLDTSVVSTNKVLQAIANAGYDNEKFTADDYAYSNLPACCQYERK